MVDTDTIRNLLALQREGADKSSELDRIADEIHFSEEFLIGEDGADRDEVIRELSSYGSSGAYEYWYG